MMTSIDLLEQNVGQIPGLPANPREWGSEEVERLARSLTELPQLFMARPILAVKHGDKLVILGGNLRYDAAKAAGMKSVPVKILKGLPVEKMREIVLADNGNFGDWDYIALSKEWDDMPLADLGIAVLAPADYSDHNKEIDPSQFSEDIVLRLKYTAPVASWVKDRLGEDKKAAILKLVGYAD